VITHTVASGDTLYGIAQQYGVSGDTITAANPELQANPNRLSIGQQLRVPVASASGADAPAAPAADAATTGGAPVSAAPGEDTAGIAAVGATAGVTQPVGVATHAVSAGETITEVAGAYSMTVDELVALNPEKLAARPALLPAGDNLVVRMNAAITDTATLLGATDATGPQSASGESNLPPEDVGEVLYPAPVLLAPGDRATVTATGPLLQWSSVGILPAGTYYVVALRDANDATAKPRLIWVTSNATAIRVPADVRPALGSTANVAWSVSVRRAVNRLFGPDEGVRVSDEGAWRLFTWAP
jgi:murein DD-endopeptidase MepM/ murein hydrolase activator NlpD